MAPLEVFWWTLEDDLNDSSLKARLVLPEICSPGGSSEQGRKWASATIKHPGKCASLRQSAWFFFGGCFWFFFCPLISPKCVQGETAPAAVAAAVFLDNLAAFSASRTHPPPSERFLPWNRRTVHCSPLCLVTHAAPLSSPVSPGAAGWEENRLRVASCWPSFCYTPRSAVSPDHAPSSRITDHG